MEYGNQTDKDVISAFYTRNEFVKIKQCLDIGKIVFSFVELENPKDNIDIYMEAEEFGAILMNSVRNGSLITDIQKEKTSTPQGSYAKSVYMSPIGGSDKNKKYGPIARYFTISPGMKADVIFQAQMFQATKSDTGAFIPKKGPNGKQLPAVKKITVPCSFKDLKILYYKWQFLEKDYMSRKYSLDNMRSQYRQSEYIDDIQVPQSDSDFVPETSVAVEPQKPAQDTNINVAVTDAETVDIKCIVASESRFFQKNNQYAVSITDNNGNPAGTLYIRGENYNPSLHPGVHLSIRAQKKGSNYLYLETI